MMGLKRIARMREITLSRRRLIAFDVLAKEKEEKLGREFVHKKTRNLRYVTCEDSGLLA
jgi:hypothetical protein